MELAQGISNAQTLGGIVKIPCDNPIRNLLDRDPPSALFELFAWAEQSVGEGRAFFDTENPQRLKSILLPELSPRPVGSLCWDCNKAAVKSRQDSMHSLSGG